MKWLSGLLLLLTVTVNANPVDTSTEHEIKEEVAGNSDGSLLEENVLKRQTVTYDQRQEGKFNVRADLENFVIVFVPSSPSQGMNLLEMLASMKRNNQAKHAIHKKYSHKVHAGQEASSSTIAKQQKEPFSARIVDQFIEGRTPYRVDISKPIEASHFNSPVEIPSADTTNSPTFRLIKSTLTGSDQPSQVFTAKSSVIPFFYEIINDKFRQKRSLADPSNQLESNSLTFPFTKTIISGDNDGFNSGDGEHVSPSISSPYLRQLTDPIPNIDSLDISDNTKADEWRLLGAIENGCGPEMKRDSYGVCRYHPVI